MDLLPQSSGLRPRLACEIASSGVVAARSPEPGLPLAAVARADLAEGAITPSLKPGNVADRVAAIAALRRSLEAVGGRANARNADLTLVIPDAAVRVLLLDFDSLPNKLSEALPIVRFRLKKLLPFDADEAMISFQIMSTSRTVVRVLAVAMPRDVLSEYESVAREAGFEPGAVLPSTLAALAGLPDAEGASLLINANPTGITTAIVRGGVLQLHRTVELAGLAAATPANLPSALFDRSVHLPVDEMLPLVNREETASEWAAQEPMPEHARNLYSDQIDAETVVEDIDRVAGLRVPGTSSAGTYGTRRHTDSHAEAASVTRYPYAAPGLTADLNAEWHNPVLLPITGGSGTFTRPARNGDDADPEPAIHTLEPDAQSVEIAQAVSVAVAYFEDSLGTPPATLLSAGPLGAERLTRILEDQGLAQANGLRLREMVDSADLAPGAGAASTLRGSLAGVVGALRS